MTRLFLVLWVLSAPLMCSARSDELRPGYLEIRQTTSNTYGLLFKIPASGDDLRLAIYVVLPEGTHDAAPARAEFNNGAYVERRTIRRDGGVGGTYRRHQRPLRRTSTDVLVRIETLDGTVQTERLTPTRTTFIIQATTWCRRRRINLICAWASSTSCSVSIICYSFWH